MTSIAPSAIDNLRAAVSGRVLEPAQAGYDEARQVHNGYIDCKPALIVQCVTVADVVDAVNHGRESGLELSIRGGGHNVAGRALVENGLVVDLSGMKGIFVDHQARTARAQGGVTWGEFNRATQLHGLATTGGVISTTGIAGLTLGGGIGWLMPKYGLSVDNLRSAEVVTASGEVVTASEKEHRDLFWALRGGGGNFGVVTSFEFELHPVGPMITGGIVAYPIDMASDMLRFFRELTATLSDEMMMFAGLLSSPDGSGTPICVMMCGHCGSPEQAEADVRPIRDFATPAMDALGPIPYTAINQMLDAGFPKGARNYWKSSFLPGLSDDAIDTMVEQFSRCPSPMSGMLLEHFHGAATRVPVEATAFAHRTNGFNFLAASEWLDPAEDDVNVAWARETYEAMRPHLATGGYVNYLAQDESEDRVAASYGPNYRRLQEVKREYDPENLFHINQNVRPG